MNLMLCKTFRRVQDQHPANIHKVTACESLCGQTPAAFVITEKDPPYPYHLARDPAENSPRFERNLYCDLDVDIIILIALWWYLIDTLTGNPMIAVAIVYLGENFLKYIRAELG